MKRCHFLNLLAFTSTVQSAPLLHNENGDNGTLYCSMVRMFPFSVGHGRFPAAVFQRVGFDYMAASQMAINHFNARNSTVIPQLEQLHDCPLQFPTNATNGDDTVVDSALVVDTAVKSLWDATHNSLHPICAVLGPFDTDATEAVAGITRALEINHLFYAAELDKFANDRDKVIATVLSPQARAKVMVKFLKQQGRHFVAIVHYGRDGSSDLAEELVKIADEDSKFVVRAFEKEGRDTNVAVATGLRRTGITTMVLNFYHPKVLNSMAKALDEQGLLSEDYLYIISPEALPTDHRIDDLFDEVEVGSSLDKLLTGALVFDQMDQFRSAKDSDPFLNAWRDQDSHFVHFLNALYPLPAGDEAYFQASDDYFQKNEPTALTSFVYDAVMVLGIGGCKALKDSEIDSTEIGLDEMLAGMIESSFQGASGRIRFNEEEHYRAPDDILVGLYNIRGQTAEGGTRTFAAELISITAGDDNWERVKGTSFIDRNGGQVWPVTLLGVENNFLSQGVRVFGFSIFAITGFLVVCAIALIFCFRKTEVILKAQPFFLFLLCVGSLITNLAIFTLSWDENAGASDSQLDAACMATPWFFFVGHIVTFMALATKAWRLDQLLQFRRMKLTVKQVMNPLIVFVLLTVIILILWTTIDPWTWERTQISEVPPETYGECTSDHTWAFFGPLIGLLVTAEALAAWYSFKTIDVRRDLSDTHNVLFAICTQIQAWAIGVPVLIVLDDSSVDATYFGRVLLIWIFSITSLLVIVGPKVYRAVKQSFRNESRRMGSIIVTGLQATPAERSASSESQGFRFRYNMHSSGARANSDEATSNLPTAVNDAKAVDASRP